MTKKTRRSKKKWCQLCLSHRHRRLLKNPTKKKPAKNLSKLSEPENKNKEGNVTTRNADNHQCKCVEENSRFECLGSKEEREKG